LRARAASSDIPWNAADREVDRVEPRNAADQVSRERYAAIPSMHVAWSLLVALICFRATSSRVLGALFVVHRS
jgi:hypothetical protein